MQISQQSIKKPVQLAGFLGQSRHYYPIRFEPVVMAKQKRSPFGLRFRFVLVGQNYNSDEIGNSIYDSSRITVFSAIFAVV